MNILYVLIPLALLLMAGAVWALFWAIRAGQFDDLESQGWSVVLDEDREFVAPGEPHKPAIPDEPATANTRDGQK